jgi:hypothetical protein
MFTSWSPGPPVYPEPRELPDRQSNRPVTSRQGACFARQMADWAAGALSGDQGSCALRRGDTECRRVERH